MKKTHRAGRAGKASKMKSNYPSHTSHSKHHRKTVKQPRIPYKIREEKIIIEKPMKKEKNMFEQVERRKDGSVRIAVLWFPGTNCEEESARVARSVGMKADILRWNVDIASLREYDGYILPGGWSYEDRIRAGVIASRDPVMDIIKAQADAGKHVLGICNGAQILVEKGMVPDTKHDIEMALAPNHNPLVSGYYCSWVRIKVDNNRGAFTSAFKQHEVIELPVAHGEGRFVTADNETKDKIRKDSLVAFRYCDEDGKIIEKFPTNPNGTYSNIAAVYNAKGNVLAIMPHPERASWMKQLPGFFGSAKEGELPAPGRKIFQSMKSYIEKSREDAEKAEHDKRRLILAQQQALARHASSSASKKSGK